VAGNSFGGIETVLGVERGGYCAGIDSAGGAQSWAQAPELQSLMTRAVRNAKAPIFFFQAANNFDLSPSKTLSAEMNEVSKAYKLKIYPPTGTPPRDGHSCNHQGFQALNGNPELGIWDLRGTSGSETVYPLNCFTKEFTPNTGPTFQGWPTFRYEYEPSKCASKGHAHDSRFVNYLVAHCGKRIRGTCKFGILPNRPHAMSVRCLGRTISVLSLDRN